jgi:hypothetical protein
MVTRLAPKLIVVEPVCIHQPLNAQIRVAAPNRVVASSVAVQHVAASSVPECSVAVESEAVENAADVDVRSRRTQIVIRDQR